MFCAQGEEGCPDRGNVKLGPGQVPLCPGPVLLIKLNGLQPAAQLHGFYNPGNGDHIGSISHIDFLTFCCLYHAVKGVGDVGVQPG